MAGNTLNVNSTLQCPHGGSVQIISANARVKVDGAFAALATDQFVISGCPFQIPIGTGTNSTPTLSKSSVGLCLTAEQIPQGPVSIVNTQVKSASQ